MYCVNSKNINKLYDELFIDQIVNETEAEKSPAHLYAKLLDVFESYSKDYHAEEEIESALHFANIMHNKAPRDPNKVLKNDDGIVIRESGDPYITHPLWVAIILASLHVDRNTLIAGILHDVVEDTTVSASVLGQKYNEKIMNYVIGVSKKGEIDNKLIKLNNSEYLRILFTKGAEDLSILIIKLADRLHNMRTLQYKKDPNKRIEIAMETLRIYAPLAGLLGLYTMKNELEDLALKHIDPEAYKLIDYKIKETISKRKSSVLNSIKLIEDCSKVDERYGYGYELKFSKKNIYSIYKQCYDKESKMLSSLDNVHDLISVQVIVDDVNKCYDTNKLIQCGAYKVESKESKDYITNPKPTMYSALHTTIYDDDKNMLQFQIKTPEMDKIDNYGFASYWDIKGHSAQKDMYEATKRNLFKPIHAIDRLSGSSEDFMDRFQEELLSEDKITVYTPKGDPIDLPAGSTVIDFAYRIHSAIGDHLDYAIISNYNTQLANKNSDDISFEDKVASIFFPLRDGDRVMLFKTEAKENEEPKITINQTWLNHCNTNRARRKINEYLRNSNEKKMDNLSYSAKMVKEQKIKGLSI